MARPRKDSRPPAPTLEFVLPRDSLFAKLPDAVGPFIEITRMHIPPINLVCFYPFAVGLAFAANTLCLSSGQVFSHGIKAYVMALLGGSAGHTIDDCLDYEVDRKYARCQSRPIVRGAMSQAVAFVYGSMLLTLFLVACLWLGGSPMLPYSLACAVLAFVYPVSKRLWNYPQIVIGVFHAIPVPMMTASLGIDPLSVATGELSEHASLNRIIAVTASYAAFAICTVIFDTGYGLLDAENDLKHGVGSMSVRFRSNIKPLLYTLAMLHVVLLLVAGSFAEFGSVYFLGCGISGVHLAYLITHLDPNSSQSAIDFFMSVNGLVEGQMVLSLLADYLHRCLL